MGLERLARPQQDYGWRVAKQVIQAGAEATVQHLCNYRAFLHICKKTDLITGSPRSLSVTVFTRRSLVRKAAKIGGQLTCGHRCSSSGPKCFLNPSFVVVQLPLIDFN